MSLNYYQLLVAMIILLTTIFSGVIPFIKRVNNPIGFSFPIGEAFANGIFLGAGLIHMLGDSAREFFYLKFDYPYPFLIAGTTVLFFLLIEHICVAISKGNKTKSSYFAIVATMMLSVHSFFEGAALGISSSLAIAGVIFLAIIAHKWAASFALSLTINQSKLKYKFRLILFITFAVMTPIGILFGQWTQVYFTNPLIQPIFTAIAAGTFIYMGTLHGLERSIMITKCCNTKEYCFVIIGFIIMSIVAIWS
jgi:solute carrier family 39 (zinc transporter), member 1/2/3